MKLLLNLYCNSPNGQNSFFFKQRKSPKITVLWDVMPCSSVNHSTWIKSKKVNPSWVNMAKNSNLQNYETQTLLTDYIKMLNGLV
jgi:hypothetical protein